MSALRNSSLTLCLFACSTASSLPTSPTAPVSAGSPSTEIRDASFESHDANLDAGGAIPPPPNADNETALKKLFHSDPKAEVTAFALLRRNGVRCDVESETDFDGGYRGTIHIVPALPILRDRNHLEWVSDGITKLNGLLGSLKSRAEHPESVVYRAAPNEVHFFRSVGRTTPSAYAADWKIGYNLAGSLNRSADAVYETLVHEVFHLNDQAHGEWSLARLAAIHQRIVARCGGSSVCLAPYAPNDTKVRGGTYYSFQPGNDVQEYAAELAVRFFREQSRALDGAPIPYRFKCAKPENADAWRNLSEEFFGGLDLVPPC